MEQVLAQNDSKAGKTKVFKFLEASLGPLCSLSSPGGAPVFLPHLPPGPPGPPTASYVPLPASSPALCWFLRGGKGVSLGLKPWGPGKVVSGGSNVF